jgi:hypothetical protein
MEYVEVNGAKIEKEHFESSLAEARSVSWEEKRFPEQLDHSHCIVCSIQIPGENDSKTYRSRIGWLCGYCYDHYLPPTNLKGASSFMVG